MLMENLSMGKHTFLLQASKRPKLIDLAAVRSLRYVGGLGKVGLGLMYDGLASPCMAYIWCMTLGLIQWFCVF